MVCRLFLAIWFLVATVASESFNFVVLSDIHYDPFYAVRSDSPRCRDHRFSDAFNISAEVRETGEIQENPPLGKHGCDTNALLLDTILQRINSIDNSSRPIDAVIITGDLLGHYIRLKHDEEAMKARAPQVRKIYNELFSVLLERFGNGSVPIITAVGNNDYLPELPQIAGHASHAWREVFPPDKGSAAES